MTDSTTPPPSRYARKLIARKRADYEQLRVSRLLVDRNPDANFELQPLLADACVSNADCNWLQNLGYPVLKLDDVGLRDAKDDQIFVRSVKYGLGIVTHDKGFASPRHHALYAVPTVIVLPSWDRAVSKAAKDAREYFGANFSLTSGLKGRVLYFLPDGSLRKFSYAEGSSIGKTTQLFYMKPPQARPAFTDANTALAL